jgi:flagellar basal-body rod protein FlgF
MQAQLDALEIVANNLANLNTTGFKEERAFFSYLSESLDNQNGPRGLSEVVNRAVRAQGSLNQSEGSLAATGRELDIAIEGNGFLAVQTPGGERYTRNGNLHSNSQSLLSTSEGYPVIGVSGRPITLGPGLVTINENGDVSLDGEHIDRLKVVGIDDYSRLTKEGSSLFVYNSETAPTINNNAGIRSGFLEQSNVNAVASMVRMVDILRHFEAIQKCMSLEMNEMNGKAIEKLGR